jgi:hypothetical protein
MALYPHTEPHNGDAINRLVNIRKQINAAVYNINNSQRVVQFFSSGTIPIRIG